MNLSELRTFLAIVETGSLVRAAERLNVTQSTVTARLKSLEDTLGQRLITRRKSGATLTAPGARLKRYADTIVNLWAQAQQEAALPGAFQAVCNIACHPDLWPRLGSIPFDWVQRNVPETALSIWTGSSVEIARWFDAGLADLALTDGAISNAKQRTIALPPDRICLFSTNPNAPVRFDPGYVFVEAGEVFGRWHATEYADANTARLNFGSAQLGLDHILTRGGTAYLPWRMGAPYLTRGLHWIKEAAECHRPLNLIVNTDAEARFPWLDGAVKRLFDAAS